MERWAIHQVSLYVGWDGDLRPEHEYDDLDAFYTRLSASSQLPATSQPSVGDFLACFEPLVSAGRDVVSVHLASGLSGTCQSAREAAGIVTERGHPGRVEVVDSQTGAGGLGCLVILTDPVRFPPQRMLRHARWWLRSARCSPKFLRGRSRRWAARAVAHCHCSACSKAAPTTACAVAP
jgi:hypothetical protein